MITLYQNTITRHFKQSDSFNLLLDQVNTGAFPVHITGLRGNYLAGMVQHLQSISKKNTLLIVSGEKEAEELVRDLSLFHDRVSLMPWWGTMLYKGVSPQAAVFGRRVKVLYEMIDAEGEIFVASLRTFLSSLPPVDYMKSMLLDIHIGKVLDPVYLEKRLQEFGYIRVPRVSVAGEFALRGEVLDIFLPGYDQAVRIVFEFDEVEEIKFFSPVTQASGEKIPRISLYPSKEVVWDDERIGVLEKSLSSEDFEKIFESLEVSGEFRGEELYYPLAFENPASLTDYLSRDDFLFLVDMEGFNASENILHKEYDDLYHRALDQGLSVPPPDHFAHSLSLRTEAHRKTLQIHNLRQEDSPDTIHFESDPGRSFFGNINYLKEEMASFCDQGYRVFVFAESESQSDRIGFMLKDYEITVIPESISGGFTLPGDKILVIQENEIFGRKKKAPASVSKAKSEIIDSFVELNPGDFVVHVNYGIGCFKGIERIRAAGNERDYISLEYAGEETIFIPIEQVNLVQRYIGQESRKPRLDKIGGKSWDNKKKKVRKSVEDLADRLVKLYAGRQTARGYAFPRDDDFQNEFEASFPYQETRDQLQAIAEIKEDLESPRPMDRLVCGDVGYGKTEIAMRAGFKAVMGGRQVAFLCPTTILAEQHYENFVERFKRFSCKDCHDVPFRYPGGTERDAQESGERGDRSADRNPPDSFKRCKI